MGKGQQKKGRAGEQELARILNEKGYPVRTGSALNFGGEPDIVGMPGIHIEVKRHERLTLPEWLRQSEADAERFGDGIPVVMHRGNRQNWTVSMTLDSFLRLYGGKNGEKPVHILQELL